MQRTTVRDADRRSGDVRRRSTERRDRPQRASASERKSAPATPPRLDRGDVLFDRYRLEAHVGKGGMADVWRAHDERLERTVAIKVLHPDLLPDDRWHRRFVAEARAASGLTHPGIVPVYDVIDDPHTPAIVFQYVEGETLAQRLKRRAAVPLDEARRIGVEVAEALDHAHQAGVIHRDVKPANILLESGSGRARLVDFGIARVIDDARAELTGTHEVLGSLRYMAPEQLVGKASDARTDIYALGLVVGEMLPDLATVPDWLRELMNRLRAPNRADRPSSAGDVARALETGRLPATNATAASGPAAGATQDRPEQELVAAAPVVDDETTVSIAAAPPAAAVAQIGPTVDAPLVQWDTRGVPRGGPEPEPAPESQQAHESDGLAVAEPVAVRGRSRSGRDLRPVALALLVGGLVLAGVALSGQAGLPGAADRSTPHPTVTDAPVVAPPEANPPGQRKGHGHGHGG